MKHLRILAPALVLALAFGLFVVPHVVRAEDSQQTEQSEAEKKAVEQEKEAAKKAAERAREAAKKLEEQRKESEKKRQEELKKADENEREAAKQQSEQQKKADEQKREAFKQACEQRRESFKNRMETVIDAVSNRTDNLDALVERIKTYVTQQGLTVASYDSLLVEANTQAGLVRSVAIAAKESADDLDCSDKAIAKESLAGFSDTVHQQIDAVQSYKTAVKSLVLAVKAAAEEAENEQ